MRNRFTNQIVPPKIPLSELAAETEICPRRTLPMHQPLWRYMGIEKLLDLITKEELYLARLDQFEDDFEGLWSQGNMYVKSRSWTAYTAAYAIASDPVQWALQQFPMRQRYFATCWHINWGEDRKMWQCYTRRSGADSVAIVTRAGVLQDHGMAWGGVSGMVEYAGRDDPIPEYLSFAPAFYKHLSYRFECEFRVAVPWPNRHTKPPKSRRLPINPRRLIKAVVVHPHARRGFGEFVLDQLRQIGCGAPVFRSEIRGRLW